MGSSVHSAAERKMGRSPYDRKPDARGRGHPRFGGGHVAPSSAGSIRGRLPLTSIAAADPVWIAPPDGSGQLAAKWLSQRPAEEAGLERA